MPALVPTPDDLARMTPAQKAKVRRAVARIALELDQAAADICDAAHAQRSRELAEWGERIRTHARHLHAMRTPEPPHVIEARRRTLLEATK